MERCIVVRIESSLDTRDDEAAIAFGQEEYDLVVVLVEGLYQCCDMAYFCSLGFFFISCDCADCDFYPFPLNPTDYSTPTSERPRIPNILILGNYILRGWTCGRTKRRDPAIHARSRLSWYPIRRGPYDAVMSRFVRLHVHPFPKAVPQHSCATGAFRQWAERVS